MAFSERLASLPMGGPPEVSCTDTQNVDCVVDFIQLTAHPDYEISTEYPYIIRRKKDEKIMKISQNNGGYCYVSINGESTELHKIIAEQFVPNPNNFPEVDHLIDPETGFPNILDNRPENLEWVPHAENLRRRQKYSKQSPEFVDSLDGLNVIQLTEYNGAKFDRYFYDKDNEKLYLKTRAKRSKDGTLNFHYKLVKPCYHNKMNLVALLTIDGESKTRSYNKLIIFCKTL